MHPELPLDTNARGAADAIRKAEVVTRVGTDVVLDQRSCGSDVIGDLPLKLRFREQLEVSTEVSFHPEGSRAVSPPRLRLRLGRHFGPEGPCPRPDDFRDDPGT